MINGNNQYWQNAAMNIRKDGDEWRLAKDTVSNTYTPEDEGKVVSDGELVSQTAMPDEVTDNGTIDTTLYDSVTVNVSGGGAGASDVTFYDYDGTVVDSYTTAEFAELSDLPANPTHDGLTAQGWNWSLADAKAYVAAYGKLDIGQMYITSDGKTRLYYVIPKDGLTFKLYLTLDEGSELDVDWGDNTEHTTWTSNDGDTYKSHEYSESGSYTVAITVVDGGFTCKTSGSDENDTTLKKVEIGNGVTTIGNSAFTYCCALSSITLPNSVESIEEAGFYNCCSLAAITIPNSVTTIGSYAFYYGYALTSISIPNSVTTIGAGAFYSCSSLTTIAIPYNVTTIGGENFSDCRALTSIIIPNGTTLIDSSAFNGCYTLTSITIPNSVTAMGGHVFYDCYSLSSVTFEPTSPPELDDDLALPTTCVIRVPQGTLSAYTIAGNYPNPSNYIYEEY